MKEHMKGDVMKNAKCKCISHTFVHTKYRMSGRFVAKNESLVYTCRRIKNKLSEQMTRQVN